MVTDLSDRNIPAALGFSCFRFTGRRIRRVNGFFGIAHFPPDAARLSFTGGAIRSWDFGDGFGSYSLALQ
jgi:hypothetical protein